MPLPALHLRRKQAIVKMGNGPDGACSGAQGTPCRLAMITAQIHRRKAPKFVIPRSIATWESRRIWSDNKAFPAKS